MVLADSRDPGRKRAAIGEAALDLSLELTGLGQDLSPLADDCSQGYPLPVAEDPDSAIPHAGDEVFEGAAYVGMVSLVGPGFAFTLLFLQQPELS
ncbi:uncharacterized protein METZ01_LOCUS261804, partial [marine metagenome]